MEHSNSNSNSIMAVATIRRHKDQGISGDVREKIKSAFSNVYSSGLLQFWAPVETLLSTSGQPFAVDHLDSGLEDYRLFCLKNPYTLNDDLSDGPPATAFLNRLPVVVNPTVDQRLTCLLVPVLHPSQTQSSSSNSSCVGVVECCCFNPSGLVVIFRKLKIQLQKLGLTTFHLQETQQYQSIRRGLKRATDEIHDALNMACILHGLALGQVWIAYENENDNHVTQNLQKCGLKLIGYCADSDVSESVIKDYSAACDTLPLKIGEGLVGNTLQTYDPLLCRNMDELRDKDKGLFSLVSTKTAANYSCLAISLRSYKTGDVDYAAEFLWPKSRNCLILLESLFLTLKRYLPSFRLACGADLGDELPLVDVGENSTTRFFKILQGNRLPLVPKDEKQKQGILSLEPKCMRNRFALPPLEEDKNQKVDCFPASKRCKYEFYQEDNSESEYEEEDDDDDVVIQAEYRGKRRFFRLRKSCKFADLKKKIVGEFNLVSESCFRLDFLMEGLRIELDEDVDLENCIHVYCISTKAPYIPVLVTPCTE